MKITGWRKKVVVTGGGLLLFVLLVILCLSPIARYLIEKYDTKLTGREIRVESAYVNPFTGFIKFNGIRIFEEQGDSVFIAAKSLSANFALFKMLFKTYEINHLWLEEPVIKVIQNKEQLNFEDVIRFYTPKHPRKKKKEPLYLNLLDMKIINGHFFYNEQSIPVRYSVRDVNVSSPGLRWDVDSMNITFGFRSGPQSGEMKGNMVVDVTNGNYKMVTRVSRYDLRFLEQYLSDLSNYGRFRANMDADVQASGNFKDAQNINLKGLISVNEFHLGKRSDEDYAAFRKFVLSIDQLSPGKNVYLFDSVSLVKPFCTFELYDRLNNIEMMFGEKGTKAVEHSQFNIIIEIGKYIEQLARNFFKSDYKINRLAMYDGGFRFNDFTLEEKFSVSADPVYILADSVKRSDKPVRFSFRAGIKPYGTAGIFISINPRDSSDFDLDYDFDQVPLTLFNPYLIKYTSFLLDRGTLALKGQWKVRDGVIASNNRLTVIDPRIYQRVDNEGNRRLPLRLITYFVRERGNVIDYEIPVTGKLRDPRLHLRDVILDLAANVFVKPVSAPYIAKVRQVERKIEKSLIMRWEMRQSTVSEDQEKFLDRLGSFMEQDEKVFLEIDQSVYVEKEKEHILLYEAKKKFYLESNSRIQNKLTQEEEESIERMSIKDSLFNRYLNRKTAHKLLFTVQDKCLELIGQDRVDAAFNSLIRSREAAFRDYFKNKSLVGRIRIKALKDKIPYNGFSFYRIDYKGDMPPELVRAYENLQDLNNKSPRRKFKTQRETRRSLIRAGKKRPELRQALR